VKVFIDTEFTDFVDPHLISIGMVGERDERFYAELPFPESAASDFVRRVVMPLLGQHPGAAMTRSALRPAIVEWLETIRAGGEVEVCHDYAGDWELFRDALGGEVPSWCRPRHVGRDINKLLVYQFHAQEGLAEHHALHDALANRFAYARRKAFR
jgi:hypothetical protein